MLFGDNWLKFHYCKMGGTSMLIATPELLELYLKCKLILSSVTAHE